MITAGGRVLCVTALGATHAEARERAYQAVDKISFQVKRGGQWVVGQFVGAGALVQQVSPERE
mgnify:CR=1 FL=1